MMRILTAYNKNSLCRLHSRELRVQINLSSLSERFARLESASILGGNSASINIGRFSYWAAEPKEIFEFQGGNKNPFEKLQRILNKYKLISNPALNTHNSKLQTKIPNGIFKGGWIGFFSYELARYIEHLPATTVDDLRMPLIRLCFYDRVIAYDHHRELFLLFALEIPVDTESPEQKLTELEKLVLESQQISIPESAVIEYDTNNISEVRCNMSEEYYLRAFERIKNYIYDGEVYQINFSRRFESEFNARPIELYHWQNYHNPSPYAAYIDAGDYKIVSASPEMFITIADGIISTKPIKGTRPRIYNTNIDQANFNELRDSEKEKAELNMIIDLERNDIAKICIPGTRSVTQPRTIEPYPTVFHAVSTIAGRLREDVSFCEILKAMFPGGSITGAPKIRTMEIIDELEPTARGVYTGSIGYIGLDGSACLNIAIRTIIIKGRKAYAQTGGGIVADSDAQAEWQETIIKAKALIEGITSVQRMKT
jgi:para-aminobenzoate synthetase component I